MIEHPILFFYMPMQPPKSCKRITFNIEQRLNKVSTKLQQRCDTHVRTYYIARTYLEIDIEIEKE